MFNYLIERSHRVSDRSIVRDSHQLEFVREFNFANSLGANDNRHNTADFKEAFALQCNPRGKQDISNVIGANKNTNMAIDRKRRSQIYFE